VPIQSVFLRRQCEQNRRASVNVETAALRGFSHGHDRLSIPALTAAPAAQSGSTPHLCSQAGPGPAFFAVGVGAFRLLHKDVGDVLEKLAYHLRFNPESKFINFLLIKSSILDDRLLKRIVGVFFIYAGLDLVEGIGLYLEKTWAEYLTLGITASFLPWEVFEIFRKLTVIRVSLLTVNVLVFLYLFSW
jgi:uncharacterized membrane protein (DUF2068 family)